MAAAIGMIAGCQKPEMVQMSPMEDVVAPVLSEVAAIEITSENMGLESAAFTWTAADYGVKTQINYAIEVSSASHAEKVVVTSGINDTKATVPYEALNAIFLYDLELASGVAEDVQFVVSAKVGESPKVYSAPVTVTVSATAAEKVYPKLFVVGSYNGWSHDSNQYLFDFTGEDKVYQGVIDFGADHASNEFKITAGAWGNDEHSMDGAHDPESKTIKLVAGGGDNINVYQAKRFYHLTFDRALTLTADFSFDQIGVIGDFNGWGGDVVMEFNASKQRFYADVEFAEDGGFKFRADAGWDVNWGSTGSGVLDSGDNIPVTAGNYRVYLNMNNAAEMTYELNAKMYGQPEDTGATEPEEPVEPEEPAAKGWGLIGVGGDWDNDIAMTASGAFWTVKDVQLTAGEGWKLRKDGAWDDNRGAKGETEPAEVSATEANEVVHNGKNMCVAADGKYDIYYNETDEVLWVVAAGSDTPEGTYWGLIGVAGDWDNDVTLKKDGDYYSVKNLALTAGGFKIRANRQWNDAANYGLETSGTIEVDTEVSLVSAGSSANIGLKADGTFDVYFDLANAKVYVMTPGKTPADAGEAVVTYVDASTLLVGLSGKFGGTEYWTDPADERKAAYVSSELTDEATYAGNYVYGIEGFAFSNGDQFKVRVNGDWIGVTGAEVEGIEVGGTDNFEVNEGGTFDIEISFDWDGLKHSNVKAVFTKK